MRHYERADLRVTERTDLYLAHVRNATWTVIILIAALSSLICGEEEGDAVERTLNLLLAGELLLVHQRQLQPRIGEAGGREGEDGAELRGSVMRKSEPSMQLKMMGSALLQCTPITDLTQNYWPTFAPPILRKTKRGRAGRCSLSVPPG